MRPGDDRCGRAGERWVFLDPEDDGPRRDLLVQACWSHYCNVRELVREYGLEISQRMIEESHAIRSGEQWLIDATKSRPCSPGHHNGGDRQR
ncbi:hypothetical protein GCM10027027_03330 [Neomicrococcus lactis]